MRKISEATAYGDKSVRNRSKTSIISVLTLILQNSAANDKSLNVADTKKALLKHISDNAELNKNDVIATTNGSLLNDDGSIDLTAFVRKKLNYIVRTDDAKFIVAKAKNKQFSGIKSYCTTPTEYAYVTQKALQISKKTNGV